MEAISQVVLSFVLICCVCYLTKTFIEDEFEFESFLAGVLGVGCLMVLNLAPIWNSQGLPVRDIGPGTYEVVGLSVDAKDVHVIIKISHSKDDEHSNYYKFNREVFEGEPKLDAKKMTVIQTGSFKKIRLE